MLRNYLKIAWRNLKKYKFYTTINILGLSLGMFCALLIWLLVRHELSYDRVYPDYQNIYAVRTNGTYNGQIYTNIVNSSPLAEALKADVPQVAYSTKITFNRKSLITYEDRATKENGLFASDDFFDVFRFPAVEGKPSEALASIDQIVISRHLAEKYFPGSSAIGKTLKLDNDKNYLVGAVIEDIPSNASVQFDWVVNFKAHEQDWMQLWYNNFLHLYVRLHPETTQQMAEANMKDIFKRHTNDPKATTYPILQPVKDIHLYSKYTNGVPDGGGIKYVRIFAVIAVFVLLVACINFMNMATARSAMRAREIGVRKVIGAGKKSLFGQFISESMLISFFACVLAIAMTWAFLPAFNRFFKKDIILDLTDPYLLLSFVVLLLITGLLSGSYPAIYLSSLPPIHNLNNKIRQGFQAAFLRKALVVFQFTISIFLIISIIVIQSQMHYTRDKELGLDQERVLSIAMEGKLYSEMEMFRNEILRSPAIESAVATSALPINVNATSGDLSWPGKDPELQTNVSAVSVGYDFAKTMKINIISGRDFSPEFVTDSTAYIINQSAAELIGYTDPVGQPISFWKGEGPIVGVLEDFHMQSLHLPITPLILCLTPENTSYMLVKTKNGQTQQAISDLKEIASRLNPDFPFEYHFLDTEYDNLYRTDIVVSTAVNYFGILAIFISGLGLLALAAFTAEQRTKEIGVRKVLGASVNNIVTMLSKDFALLIVIAFAIASPIAWYAMTQWLNDFAYRITLQWWMFLLAGGISVLLAWITVSGQSIKAATANPVKSLRSE